MEPLINDPLRKDNLFTKDTSNIPKSVYAIHFQLPKEDSLPTKELVPKCPLVRGPIVLIMKCFLFLYNKGSVAVPNLTEVACKTLDEMINALTIGNGILYTYVHVDTCTCIL